MRINFWFCIAFVALLFFSRGSAAPISPVIANKLLTLLNSVKAALPNTDSAKGDSESKNEDGQNNKKMGQPTSFEMDDRSPEIEVKTSDEGVDVRAKPASLQVLSKPEQKVTQEIAEVEREYPVQKMPHMFIRNPVVEHPIQPIYYGGRPRNHRRYRFRLPRPRFRSQPFRFYPYRRMSNDDGYGYGDDDDDDGYEDDEFIDGFKKGEIPTSNKKLEKFKSIPGKISNALHTEVQRKSSKQKQSWKSRRYSRSNRFLVTSQIKK